MCLQLELNSMQKCYQKTKINDKISVSLLLFCTVCIHSDHIKEHIISFKKYI